MTLSPTYLIYRTGFAPTNGHSVQLERLFREAGESLVHLMWDDKEAGAKSVRWVVNTSQTNVLLQRPFRRLNPALQRLRPLFVPLWWRWGGFDSARLQKALARIPIRPHQAYINCYDEYEAGKAAALWDATGRPSFVLHVVDILEQTLSAEKTPHTVRLIREAGHVLCLNRLIEAEMRRLGARQTSLFPLVSDLETSLRQAPGEPVKIILSGALYAVHQNANPALQLLSDLWPKLAAAFPGAELHYSGADSKSLPADMRPWVHDHGLLPVEDYQRLLNSCHVAYVPVCHTKENHLRYSLPSRITDYLIRGLPVLACAEPETGPYEFFQSSPRECTRLVQNGDEFLEALRHFAGDAERWETASGAAIGYSKQAFSVESARELMFERLNAVGSAGRPS